MHQLSTRVAQQFRQRGWEAFVVGGLVRDALLGAPEGNDLDFATSARPEESRAALRAAGGVVYDLGERFGTTGALFGDVQVEVTTYRAEAYEPGSRKPSVAFHANLEADLARRDFTVNAMALDPLTGEMVDPFGGRGDLESGLIRAVGRAEERFTEDPLRLLRAVRFAARLSFRLDPDTERAVQSAAASLQTISRERVRDELDKLLLAPFPSRGVRLLCDLGLAAHTLPGLLEMRGMRQETGRHKDVFAHTLQVLDRTPPRLALRWAALLHDVAKPRTLSVSATGEVHSLGHDAKGERMARRILTDLHQPGELVEHASRLVGLHLRANAYDATWTDGAVRRFVLEVGEGALEDLLALSRADVTSGQVERRTAIARSVAELESRVRSLRAEAEIERMQSPLDGLELMALFQRPGGAWIRPIKEHLKDLVVDGALAQDDKAQATQIARRLYAELDVGETT